jgi:uncharacterized protein DUF6557
MATVGELFHSLDRDEVIGTLAAIYGLHPNPPIDYPSYRSAWDIIVGLEAVRPNGIVCELYAGQTLDHPSQTYIGVHGHGSDQDCGYAIEFTPWDQWLSMEVRVLPECGDMSPIEQLARILWEMTLAGYSPQEVAGCLDQLLARCLDDLIDQMDEVRKAVGAVRPSYH